MVKENIRQEFRLKNIDETINYSVRQCYHIVWSVGKILKIKIQKLQGQKTEK